MSLSDAIKVSCAKERMMSFVYGNLRYPEEAEKIDDVTIVQISFDVDDYGRLSNFQLDNDSGFGFGEESLRVVRLLPRFLPGKENGQKVMMNYSISMKFVPPDDNKYICSGYREIMPRFYDCECEGLSTGNSAKDKCSKKKLIEFIYNKLQYPKVATKNKILGAIVVTFTILESGQPVDFKIVRDKGYGLGDEALRVAKQLPNFIPGTQQGKRVRVQYNLPIKFKLPMEK